MHLCAGFALKLQGDLGFNEKQINAVLEHASELLDAHYKLLIESMNTTLIQRGLEALPNDIFDDVADIHGRALHALDSQKKREQYFANHAGYVQPKAVKLGEFWQTNRQGVLQRREKVGYTVPLEESLKELLQMDDVWYWVKHSHASPDQFLADLCDGEYINSHPLFIRNPNALQLVLYNDDIEIVNPIGTHVKKHKLTLFYYMLGNIPPQFRSKLTCIQLVAVAKTADLKKYGLDGLLKDFIDTVNRLSQGGIVMEVKGIAKTIEGALIVAPADTLASQWIGGFKEGVGFAYKICRTCEATKDQYKTKIGANDFENRDEAVHRERCQTMQNLSKRARTYWSKEWGINSSSCLLKVVGFPLCSGLVHDPMHILLEGILKFELQYLLFECITVKRYFSLEYLNGQLLSFNYSYLDTTHPEQFTK
jgi:hypothetical protein